MGPRFWAAFWRWVMLIFLFCACLMAAGYMLSPVPELRESERQPPAAEQPSPSAPSGANGTKSAPIGAEPTPAPSRPIDALPATDVKDTPTPTVAYVAIALLAGFLVLTFGIKLGRPDGPLEKRKQDRRELVELRAQRDAADKRTRQAQAMQVMHERAKQQAATAVAEAPISPPTNGDRPG